MSRVLYDKAGVAEATKRPTICMESRKVPNEMQFLYHSNVQASMQQPALCADHEKLPDQG